MSRKRRRSAMAMALALLLVLAAAGCGDDDDSADDAQAQGTNGSAEGTQAQGTDTSSAPADDGTPVRGGRLVLATPDEATLGLEPWTAVVGAGGGAVATAIYDTLAAFNAEGEAVPFLAESLEPNIDATEWTVTLRSGVKFHDGSDLTADAIKFMFDNASAAGRVLQEGFTVEVVDELTARFSFLQPFSSFPSSMATQWGWVVSPTAARDLGDDFKNRPVGSGPYVFKEWIRDDHITLVRNENYWRDDVAFLDEIEFRPIIDDSVRRAALLAGDVDAIVVGQADIATFREEDGFTVTETVAGVGAVTFNTSKPMFADLRVRQALAHAIDVEAIIATVYDGVGTPATGPLPHDNPFYREVEYPTYDPERAAALIEEYEQETGEPVEFEYLFSNVPLDQELAQLLQSYWQDAGASVTLGPPLNSGDLQTRRGEHQFDVVISGMPPVFDPDTWLPLFRSDSFLNYSAMQDPEIDQAIDDGRSEVELDARVDAYGRLQERLAEELSWFFFREAVLAVAAQPNVRGLDSWTLPDGSPGTSKQFWIPFTADALWIDSGGG